MSVTLRTCVASVVFVGAAAVAPAQEHADCPMHQAQVEHRHSGVTGIPAEAAEHHFLTAPDGGSIRLEMKSSASDSDIERIRVHLQAIAKAFAVGDFAMPVAIHQKTPPGVPVMQERASAIKYVYSSTARGGVVTISTTDPVALGAVHEFLQFQVDDHGTGDPRR